MSRIQQLTQLLKDEPNDSFLHYALALEYTKDKEIQKAILQIENLIAQDENYLPSYYQLGKLYEQANQPEKAKNSYIQGITIAKKQFNTKTLNELNEALQLLTEDDD